VNASACENLEFQIWAGSQSRDPAFLLLTDDFLYTQPLMPSMKSVIERLASMGEVEHKPEARAAFLEFRDALTQGKIRAAERKGGDWIVNAWVKQGILLGFRLGELAEMRDGPVLSFVDKDTFPARQFTVADRVRVVPGGSSVRVGAYVAPSVICMPPMFINVGAYVDEGTMVDSHALVGSCAQVGKRVHISAAAQIGGVLEPLQASPVIVEDGCFIGSRCIVVEGVRVEKEAVLGANVVLTQSTKIIDVSGREPVETKGVVPARSVVIPGSYNKTFPAGEYNVSCALIIGKRKASTDLKTSLNDALREFNVAV